MNEELTRYTKTIGHFFLDEDSRTVDGNYIARWNITLGLLADVYDKNVLLIGEPGHGKTTFARLISSLNTGLPIDFIDHAMIKGHPDQTWESMIARPDYGQLNTGVEKVIWSSSLYIATMIIDEFNRLPAGKQSSFLNALQTGRYDYLNDTFENDGSLFATANHQDDGNGVIVAPAMDRFSLALEFGWQGSAQSRGMDMREKRISELRNRDLSKRVTAIIQDTKTNYGEKASLIDTVKKEYKRQIRSVAGAEGRFIPSREDYNRWREDITKIEFTSDAQIFLDMLYDECNSHPTTGRLRSNEAGRESLLINPDARVKAYASSNLTMGYSNRGRADLQWFSQALAYYTASHEATKGHIMAVLPHVLGHRLGFSEDFKATVLEKPRTHLSIFGLPSSMFMAHVLAEGVDGNYELVKAGENGLDNLFDLYQQMEGIGQYEAQGRRGLDDELRRRLIDVSQRSDHPTVRSYARSILADEE